LSDELLRLRSSFTRSARVSRSSIVVIDTLKNAVPSRTNALIRPFSVPTSLVDPLARLVRAFHGLCSVFERLTDSS
jgi:hypothetical protein